MKLLYVASLMAVLAVAPATAQTSSDNAGVNPAGKSGGSSENARFIDHAARDGKAEVELAQLAQQRAGSAEVKSVAQRLAQDHSKANQQLMQIAQQQGVEPPTGVGKKNSQTRAKLEKLNGAAFDRAYLREQIADHKQDIQYFKHQAGTLQDPQLKAFAQQTLPTLQQHLQLLQQAEAQTASAGSSGATPSTTSR